MTAVAGYSIVIILYIMLVAAVYSLIIVLLVLAIRALLKYLRSEGDSKKNAEVRKPLGEALKEQQPPAKHWSREKLSNQGQVGQRGVPASRCDLFLCHYKAGSPSVSHLRMAVLPRKLG